MAFLRITKTPNNHSMEEAYSGLQKSLRRGLIHMSLYFAREIGTKYPHLLKKRLCLVVLEDMCSISLALEIYNCTNELKNLEYYVGLVAIVPKTHISAWLNRYAVEKLITSKYIKSESIGKLIKNGEEIEAAKKAMFYKATGKEKKIFEELKDAVEESKISSQEKILELFKFTNSSSLEWLSIILWHTRSEIRDACNYSSLNFVDQLIEQAVVPDLLDPLPDWVYDKHTRIGKSLKRGYQHFFESSLIMDPKLYQGPEPYEKLAKDSYLNNELKSSKMLKNCKLTSIKVVNQGDNISDLNIINDNISIPEIILGKRQANNDLLESECIKKIAKSKDNISENEENALKNDSNLISLNKLEDDFSDFLQAQLITRKNAPRVYFCIKKENKETYVIKGPDNKYIKNYMISQKLKEILGLSHANSYSKQYAPGIIDPVGGYYSISSCIGLADKYDCNNYEIKGKTLEKDVKISKNQVFHWNDEKLSSEVLTKEIFLGLAFRKCIGTNDTCDRNFIIHEDNKIISIDDPALLQKTKYLWKKALNIKRASIYSKKLSENWAYVMNSLQNWIGIIENLSETCNNDLKVEGFTEENKSFFIAQAEFLSKKQDNWKW